MKTVFDYLNFYNDICFEECAFNDMDNIVFSTLAYLPLNDMVDKGTYSIKHISEMFLNQKGEGKSIKNMAIKILNIISEGKRYQSVVFSNYVSLVDDKTQFGAITFRFNNGECYVAFKGTDNSLIGWKEDLELSYKYPVMAQSLAAHYLKNTIKFSDKVVYVGGHSKGGNLAMASVMEINRMIYNKIKTVYNNDGPGFRKEQFDSIKYKTMAKKLKMFMPEDSLVGILLLNVDKPYIVKSNEIGIMQHYPTNWNCFGQFLVEGKLSKNSKKIQKQFNDFLEKSNDNQKQLIINTLFDVLQSSGINYFNQIKNLNVQQLSTMVKEAQGIDNNSKQILLDILKGLLFNKQEN